MDIDYCIENGNSPQNILIEMKRETGLNLKELAEYFEIPYRTMQDWMAGKRIPPDYVIRMMAYQLRAEGMINNKKEKGR